MEDNSEKIFNAADFGIVPNEDISEKLAEFISVLKAEDGEKTAVFDSGTYYIDSKRCKEYMLVITNTAGRRRFRPTKRRYQRRSILFRRRVGSCF